MAPICGLETDDDGLPHECPHCGGSGTLLVCCDDICQGLGYCMHGDGEEMCPACDGSGAAKLLPSQKEA